MRMISKREGGDTDMSRDYEYTDWNAVKKFVNDFIMKASLKKVSSANHPLLIAGK